MLEFNLTAKTRQAAGKGGARRLRNRGLTPGILYGPKCDSVALELDTKSLTKILLSIQEQNAVYHLAVDGGDVHHVVLKEVQVDPVSNSLLHVDFQEVEMDKPISLAVQVLVTGHAKGVELGGELNVARSSVMLRGLILDIPDSITIDITDLNIGDSIALGDLDLPDGITLAEAADTTCVLITSASNEPLAVEDAEEEGENEGAGEAAAA